MLILHLSTECIILEVNYPLAQVGYLRRRGDKY
jgi:hypothetical protein